MFTKKIYFSGENLAIIFKNLSGVVKILPGIINSKFNGVEVQFNPKKIDKIILAFFTLRRKMSRKLNFI